MIREPLLSLAWTTTTPVAHPKDEPKKDLVAIMAAHRIPYAATATISYPEDLIRKFQKAKSIRGAKFIHLLAPCPPGWRSEASDTIRLTRLAVQSKIFPLYEIERGMQYNITVWPEPEIPIREYMRLQGRFRHLKEGQIQMVQEEVDKSWARLVEKAKGK